MALGAVLLLCAGIAIAWVDTRPTWDDAGITAGSLFLVAAAGSLARVPGWLSAILVAGPILIAERVWVAIPFALAGALAAAFVRRLIAERS